MLLQKHVLQDIEYGDADGSYTVITCPKDYVEPKLSLFEKIGYFLASLFSNK